LTGSGLGMGTDVVLQYVDSDGNHRAALLNPGWAAADGSAALVTVPDYANGAFTLGVLGSAFAPTLQVVPVVTSVSVANGYAEVRGRGFVEGHGSTYSFAGADVADAHAYDGPDVQYRWWEGLPDSGYATLAAPAFGGGTFSVRTAGGT